MKDSTLRFFSLMFLLIEKLKNLFLQKPVHAKAKVASLLSPTNQETCSCQETFIDSVFMNIEILKLGFASTIQVTKFSILTLNLICLTFFQMFNLDLNSHTLFKSLNTYIGIEHFSRIKKG